MAGGANRRCVFATEISPAYIDVAVERRRADTCRDAILDEDGRSLTQVKAEQFGENPAEITTDPKQKSAA